MKIIAANLGNLATLNPRDSNFTLGSLTHRQSDSSGTAAASDDNFWGGLWSTVSSAVTDATGKGRVIAKDIRGKAWKVGQAVLGVLGLSLGSVGAYFFKENSSLANYGCIGVAIFGLGTLIHSVITGGATTVETREGPPIPAKHEFKCADKFRVAELGVLKYDPNFGRSCDQKSDVYSNVNNDQLRAAVAEYLDQFAADEIVGFGKTLGDHLPRSFSGFTTNADELSLNDLKDRFAMSLGYVLSTRPAAPAADPHQAIIDKFLGVDGIKSKEFSKLLPEGFIGTYELSQWFNLSHLNRPDSIKTITDKVSLNNFGDLKKLLDPAAHNIADRDNMGRNLTELQNTENMLKVLHETFRFVLEDSKEEATPEIAKSRVILRQALASVFGSGNAGNLDAHLREIYETQIKIKKDAITVFTTSKEFSQVIKDKAFPYERLSGKAKDGAILDEMSEIYEFLLKPTAPA